MFFAKIPRHTRQNVITEGDFKCILARNCEGTEGLRICEKEEETKVSRVYNFSAGPAVLPEEVLKEAQAEMLDYNGTGMSVMEMSHRSKAFDQIIQEAEKDL